MNLFYRIFLFADGFSLIHVFYFQLGYGILPPLYFRWQDILLTLGVYCEGLYPCFQTTVLLNSIFVQSFSMFKITNQLLQPNLMIFKLKKEKNRSCKVGLQLVSINQCHKKIYLYITSSIALLYSSCALIMSISCFWDIFSFWDNSSCNCLIFNWNCWFCLFPIFHLKDKYSNNLK